MKKSQFMRAAVAACFGVVAGQAGAVVDFSVATPTGSVKFAKELPSTATTLTNAGNALDLKVAVPTGYAVTAANPLYVKLNLTGGASFATSPTIGCGTAAAASAAAGTLQLGGAGTSFAVFTIASSDTTMSGSCTAAMGNLTVKGDGATVQLSATVEYKNGLNNTVTGVIANYVSYVKGMSAGVISADSAIVVDATTGSLLFVAASSNRNSTKLGTLGLVQYSNAGTGLSAAGAAATYLSAGDVISTAAVTVSGPAVAAAIAANGASGIFLDAAASACTTKSYTIGASAANAVTFSGISLTDISAGVNVCINVSGTTVAITTGQMTASVTGTAVAGVTADFSNTGGLEFLTSNGVSKNAYLIHSGASTSKTSVLRIINTGGNSGLVSVTAYNEAGTVIGTPNSSLGTVAAGQMVTKTSAELETLLGLTIAPTEKYRLVVSGGLAAFKILNFTKDVVGGYIVLSQSQDD